MRTPYHKLVDKHAYLTLCCIKAEIRLFMIVFPFFLHGSRVSLQINAKSNVCIYVFCSEVSLSIQIEVCVLVESATLLESTNGIKQLALGNVFGKHHAKLKSSLLLCV